jgi:hypothetical protein
MVGPSEFYPAEFFALHPDYTFLTASSPSSTLFQSGRFFDPYGISGRDTISTLFQQSQESYRYRTDPPLKLPVKCVVPPRNCDVWYGPTRRLSFEDSSACGSTNKSTNDGRSKRMCLDDYSRIVSDVSRRPNSKHFQEKFHSNLPRNIFNGSRPPPASVNERTNIISDRQVRKRSH